MVYKNINSRSAQTDVVFHVSCFAWFIKMSPRRNCRLFWLPWHRKGASVDIHWKEGRLLVWWGAGVLWETAVWGGVGEEIWSRLQGEKHDWQVSRSLLAFFRAQRAGGKFGPHVDAKQACRGWQSLNIVRSHRLIRFLCLKSYNPISISKVAWSNIWPIYQ